MITRENLKDVINAISEKDKKRLKNTNKEYIILELHCFNVGARVDIKLTNKTPLRLNNGEVVLYSNDVVFDAIRY